MAASKPGRGKADSEVKTSFSIPSTSHEYSVVSWWAAQVAGATHTSVVGEEADHRQVWGLRPGAPEVAVPYGKTATLHACARAIDGRTVGLSEEPALLCELVLRAPPGVHGDDVLEKAAAAYAAHFGGRGIKVYYTRKYFESVTWKLFGTMPARPLSSVKLGGGLEAELLADARAFLSSEAAYTRTGRPYKRVYCLHGPPGTGKTSTVTAIAGELGRPLAIYNVGSLRDDTFLELLSDRPRGCVLMFEDVDALFQDKRTKSTDGGMTFSTLLNALDGVLHPRGALVFLTTNHLDRLDAAMQRPGRIDRMVEVPLATAEQAADIWRSFFPSAPPPKALLARLAAKGLAPARLSETLFMNRDAGPDAAIAALAPSTK
jgi:hypothetical protein